MKSINSGYLEIAVKALQEYCNTYGDGCENCPFYNCTDGCPVTKADEIREMIYEAESEG